MKTLLLTIEYPPFKGGVANYYSNLVKYWPGQIEVWQQDDLLKKSYYIPWLAAFFKLKKYLHKNPDSQILIGHVLPLGTVAWLNYLIKPFNYSVFFHGMDFSFALRSKRKTYLMIKSLNKAQKIICANSHVAKLITDWKKEYAAKIVLATPGINEDIPVVNNIGREKYQTAGKIVLLSLGRLVDRKGFDKTLEALALLDDEYCDRLVYIIAGTGDAEKKLEDLAINLKIQVIFTGEINEAEKWGLLQLCDIFVMPAREINGDFEGFGIVYLEANLYSKPVIAGRSGGVLDAVSDNESGLLIDPENIQEISSAIKFLTDNQAERERLGKLGKERVLKYFKWSDIITKLSNNL